MAHHGPNPLEDDGEPDKLAEMKKKLLESVAANPMLLGDTGEYPDGQINEDDEGEIRFAVTHDKGRVLVDFGKPVHWMGMDPPQARQLATMLLSHAAEARIIKPKG